MLIIKIFCIFEQIHDMYERKMVTSNGEAKVFSTWTHGTKSEYPSPGIDCQNIADYKYNQVIK